MGTVGDLTLSPEHKAGENEACVRTAPFPLILRGRDGDRVYLSMGRVGDRVYLSVGNKPFSRLTKF